MAGEEQKPPPKNKKNGKLPTQEFIDQCIKTLEDEKKTKRAQGKAYDLRCDLLECVEDYKICCLVKSREVWDTYNNLDLCYTVAAYKKVVLLNEDIKKYCDKEKELEQKLKEAVKCVKETKTKLNDVVNEACKIDRCIKEEKRCKKGLHEQLKGANNEWKELLESIETGSVDCFTKACEAFDVGVDVVGLQTFVDIESLKKLGEDLAGYMDAYTKDMSTNIQKAEAEWKKAREEVVQITKELMAGKFAKCDADNCKDAVEDTLEFLCDPDACDNLYPSLEELCQKVKENFGKEIGEEYEEDEKHKKSPPKQRPRQKSEDEKEWDIE